MDLDPLFVATGEWDRRWWAGLKRAHRVGQLLDYATHRTLLCDLVDYRARRRIAFCFVWHCDRYPAQIFAEFIVIDMVLFTRLFDRGPGYGPSEHVIADRGAVRRAAYSWC